MIGLLAASVWCWAIIINKTLLIRRARAAMGADDAREPYWPACLADARTARSNAQARM